jgi:hypothetical protein
METLSVLVLGFIAGVLFAWLGVALWAALKLAGRE